MPYIVQCALDKANELRADYDDLILVSFSDKDLIKAAKNEGLLTFDPETDSESVMQDTHRSTIRQTTMYLCRAV